MARLAEASSLCTVPRASYTFFHRLIKEAWVYAAARGALAHPRPVTCRDLSPITPLQSLPTAILRAQSRARGTSEFILSPRGPVALARHCFFIYPSRDCWELLEMEEFVLFLELGMLYGW